MSHNMRVNLMKMSSAIISRQLTSYIWVKSKIIWPYGIHISNSIYAEALKIIYQPDIKIAIYKLM